MLVSGSEALFEDGTRTSRPSSRLPSASKCNATVFSESPAFACERRAISDARFGDGVIADSRNAEDARVRRWPPPQKSQKTVKSRPRIDAPPGFRYPRPHLATGGPRAPCPRPGVCGCASRKLLASLLRNFGLENDATMPRLEKKPSTTLAPSSRRCSSVRRARDPSSRSAQCQACAVAPGSPAGARRRPRTPFRRMVRPVLAPEFRECSSRAFQNAANKRIPTNPNPAVAAGLLALVETHPSNVAKMLSAPDESAVQLVDRIAGVMAVNSLSAEAVLARFFSGDLMSAHLAGRLGKSGKGNPATLAARIVAQWRPGAADAKKRKSRGEQAAEAARAATAAEDAAGAKRRKADADKRSRLRRRRRRRLSRPARGPPARRAKRLRTRRRARRPSPRRPRTSARAPA